MSTALHTRCGSTNNISSAPSRKLPGPHTHSCLPAAHTAPHSQPSATAAVSYTQPCAPAQSQKASGRHYTATQGAHSSAATSNCLLLLPAAAAHMVLALSSLTVPRAQAPACPLRHNSSCCQQATTMRNQPTLVTATARSARYRPGIRPSVHVAQCQHWPERSKDPCRQPLHSYSQQTAPATESCNHYTTIISCTQSLQKLATRVSVAQY